MGRKLKVLPEIKVAAVEDYLKDQKSIAKISEELSVCTRTVKDWIIIFVHKEHWDFSHDKKQPLL